MKTRLVFFGTSEFAVPVFSRLLLISEVEVAAAVTRPDAPVGRSQELTLPPVKIAAERAGLKVLQPESLKDQKFIKQIKTLDAQIALVAAYGKIIPREVLALFPKGVLNLHPSLLPRYRGPSPIQAAILAGDKETGVTLMLLDSEMDHGPIAAQTRVLLTGAETAKNLESKLSATAADLLADALPKFLEGELIPREQDHAQATFCPLLTRESGKIDWTKTAEEIERMSRAYEGWPEIWAEWTDGTKKMRLKLFEAALGGPELPPGQPADFGGRLAVGTGRGTISFDALQLEGKKRMSLPELLRGFPAFLSGSFALDHAAGAL